MTTYGLVATERRLVAVSDGGSRISAARSDQAAEALLERIVGSELVLAEDLLRQHPALAVALSARVTLLIAPSDLVAAACLLARASPRSARRQAALLAKLPAIPWLSRFLRRAEPSRQLRLL